MKNWESAKIISFSIENLENDEKLKGRIKYSCNECGQTHTPVELITNPKFVCKNCGVIGKYNFKLISIG